MTGLRRCGALFTLSLTLYGVVCRAQPKAIVDLPTHGAWGEQADGTYANPVLPADFSDLDVTLVGDTFYAISSTLQYSPGMTVLSSRDLVNWKILGGVVDNLTDLEPELDWQHMSRAGRGVWAGSIRYHDGEFWVFFTTPDRGIFVSTATHAAGPWSHPRLVLDESGWDDPCPLWDAGKLFLVATHFAPEGAKGVRYNIHLFELASDGGSILPGTDRVIHQSRGSEANKLYRWNGLYYHYFSEVRAEGRVPMMERASSLDGPWEVRQIGHVHPAVDKEPNQGGFVQTRDGRWWFLTHQGRGDWEGRAAVLLPVTWADGWPIPGRVGSDGIGNMVWHGEMPVQGEPKETVAVSDDFTERQLRPEWQWNYQPRSGMWSLTERRGVLRLHAFVPLKPNDPRYVGDVLTQRSQRTGENEVTVELDTHGMVSGQEAGLTHFAKTAAALSVVRLGPARTLTVCVDGQRTLLETLHQSTVWLRSSWGFDGLSRFSYSLDGTHFTVVGAPYQLTWGNYRGDRIGLFTTGQDATPRGYADFSHFVYRVAQ